VVRPLGAARPRHGIGGIRPQHGEPGGYFEYEIRSADLSPVSFGALLFGPAALLAVGATATVFAVRRWARAVTTAVVVLACVAGLFSTSVFAFAATVYGSVLDYGAALAFVGYVIPLTLHFFLPHRDAPVAGAPPSE
jgi:hypothetical protein